MDKKGTSILVIIFELLIVVLVVFTTARVAYGYGSSLFAQKINLAEDIAMMVNTLAGVPGDAAAQYPKKVSEFNIILRKNSVAVFEEGDTSAEITERSFYLPKGYDASGTLKKEDFLCLEKRGQRIFLRRCLQEDEGKKAVEGVGKTPLEPAEKTFYGLEIKEDRVIFVIDHSGSMRIASEWIFSSTGTISGLSKMETAKSQLKNVLQQVEDGKKFNIIFFDSVSKAFKEDLVELNAGSRQEAEKFIASFQPGEGTNTGEALEKALSFADAEAIYLLTDGKPDLPGSIIADKIRSLNADKKIRIDTIGILAKIPAEAGENERAVLEKENKEGKEFLQQLAQDSGGRFVTQD